MQEEQLRNILDAIPNIGKVTRSGDWHVSISCMLAETNHPKMKDNHPSMTISFGPELSFVTCWSCGYRNTLVNLLFELNARYGGLAAIALNAQKIELERPLQTLSLEPKALEIPTQRTYTTALNALYKNTWSAEATAFLESKGVSLEIARKFGCAFVPEGMHVEIPYSEKAVTARYDLIVLPVMTKINNKYECIGAQARYITLQKTHAKYFALFPFEATNYLFGEQLLEVKKTQPILITEGPFDTMHLVGLGLRSVAIMGKSLRGKKIEKIQAVNPNLVILLLDPDSPGQRSAEIILKTLTDQKLTTISRKLSADPKYLSKSELNTFLPEFAKL